MIENSRELILMFKLKYGNGQFLTKIERLNDYIPTETNRYHFSQALFSFNLLIKSAFFPEVFNFFS